MPKYRPLVRLNQQNLESLLEKVITKMIAEDLGVQPEDVTPEFMHNWREKYLYPNGKVELKSLYGGYNPGRRRVLTPSEINSFEKKAEAFLRKRNSTPKS